MIELILQGSWLLVFAGLYLGACSLFGRMAERVGSAYPRERS